MCLSICNLYERLNGKPIAGDINVFKAIKINNVSVHQDFQYTPNTKYSLGKPLEIVDGNKSAVRDRIFQGFHAWVYSSVTRNKKNIEALLAYTEKEHLKIVELTIPANSIVYYGWSHDIVSDNIISGDLADTTQLWKDRLKSL